MNKFIKIQKTLKQTRYSLKIVSVLLSLFLWFFVVKSQPVSIQENIDIDYDLPVGYDFYRQPLSKINVSYKGLRANLRRGEVAKNKIKIDIPQKKHSRFIYREEISHDQIPRPSGVQIEQFGPKKIELHIEKTLKKRVKIEVALINGAPKGMRFGEISIRPKEVMISGAHSIIKNINSLSTMPIDPNNVDLDEENFSVDLDIPKLVRIEELDQNKVNVDLDLIPIRPIEKNLSLPINFITNGDSKFNSTQKEAKVFISYLAEDIADFKTLEIKIFADLTKNNDKKKSLINLDVIHPKNVKLIKVVPNMITVEKY